MVKPPIKKAAVKARTTVSASKLKDPGRLFYKPAVRDAVSRGDITQAKALLKAAKDIKAGGGLDALIGDLETAIARGK
ncbi:MAG TPA: hypothetical protein VEW71_06585 [Allosphingosinicella sp.]|nr:hypothetical protein [Allosphingosinicella sp.]